MCLLRLFPHIVNVALPLFLFSFESQNETMTTKIIIGFIIMTIRYWKYRSVIYTIKYLFFYIQGQSIRLSSSPSSSSSSSSFTQLSQLTRLHYNERLFTSATRCRFDSCLILEYSYSPRIDLQGTNNTRRTRTARTRTKPSQQSPPFIARNDLQVVPQRH